MNLHLVTFNRISTQFTEIRVEGAIIKTSWQCTRLKTHVKTGTLVTFTLYIITSEITGTVDAVTKTGLLMLAEIRTGELITQMAVTGTGTDTSQTWKQCTNDS